jgi:hypothetical protein
VGKWAGRRDEHLHARGRLPLDVVDPGYLWGSGWGVVMSTCMHEAAGCRVAEVMEVRDEGGNQHAIRRDLEGCRVAEVMEVRRWQQLELR